MIKSVLATAFALLYLSVSAQLSSSKNVLSFGNINSASHASNSKTAVTNFAPFELVGGLMFVDGDFNGNSGTFILDTGAPGLILNDKIAAQQDASAYIASGLTGNASISELVVDEFKILDIVKTDFMAYQMDLEHIEDEILHRFAGLIGSDIFDQSILMLDYKNKVWGTMQHVNLAQIDTQVPFVLKDHFIIINIKIAGEIYDMIVDTGAEINILDSDAVTKIKRSKLKAKGNTNIQSASRDHQSSDTVKLQKFQINKHTEKNQEFSILPFDFINEGLGYKLDGLIGYPFLADKKIALDFRSGTLYIYK